jgi:SAM-dependent methyltransferase
VTNRAHDPTYLREDQYSDDRNLRRRQALHQRYSTSTLNWSNWLFDQFAPLMSTQVSILEVGAGTGSMWIANAKRLPSGTMVTVTDFSPGMLAIAERGLAEAGVGAHMELADVQALPFASGSFHGVVADHMLYHVPDRTKALGEIARVLRPDGWLAAATNGSKHLAELDQLIAQFVGPDAVLPTLPFSLENGSDQLHEWFGTVGQRRFPPPGDLEVTDPQPIVDYIRSLPGGDGLDETREGLLRQFVHKRIATDGCFRIHTDAGVFIASRPRTEGA